MYKMRNTRWEYYDVSCSDTIQSTFTGRSGPRAYMTGLDNISLVYWSGEAVGKR